ncbi:MAG: hypothetical protein MK080_12120 [Opitutales bacterium]|nr:hypothetical protein [Opitutales bacterium]
MIPCIRAQNAIGKLPSKDVAPTQSDPAALKVIANAINALGGREARENIQNLVLSGKETYLKDTYETFIFKTRDNQIRIERRRNLSGRPIEFYWIAIPDRAWSVEYFRGEPTYRWFTESEGAALLFDHQMFPKFFNYAEKEVYFSYIEKKSEPTGDQHVIRAFLPTGHRIDYDIDATSFLPTAYHFKLRANGRVETRSIIIKRYMQTNNTLWPAEYDILADNSLLGKLNFNRVASNQQLPEDLFTPPDRKFLSNEENTSSAEPTESY